MVTLLVTTVKYANIFHKSTFMRFYELQDEFKQYMKMKEKSVGELNDSKWLCDFSVIKNFKYFAVNCQATGPQTTFSAD